MPLQHLLATIDIDWTPEAVVPNNNVTDGWCIASETHERGRGGGTQATTKPNATITKKGSEVFIREKKKRERKGDRAASMDRHRSDRSGDRHGDHSGDRQGDRYGDGGRRTSSRWSSDSPTHQHHRYPRGGGAGGSEGFSGGGGGPGRYHPYRVPQDFPAPPPPTSGGEGFRNGGRGGGNFDPSMQMGGPRRGGFSGRGAPPTGSLMH
ncbi:hypothetical protein GW17_00052752 [Ensete ventricosum]|nr:hypothetical protein GW17_00052752 [Ensete ventricosum]